MKKYLRRFYGILAVVLLYCTIFCILNFSNQISEGIKKGVSLSINLVIPSMLIFIILSNFIMNTKLKYTLARPFRLLGKYIFRLSDSKLSIVILSLIGGYPVGARLLSNAVNKNELSAKEASLMLSFCVNCGPAFLIGGIGGGAFNSSLIGLYLYLSQVIACFAVGFISRFFIKIKPISLPSSDMPKAMSKNKLKTSLSSAFVSSVTDAIRAMAVICGFVVVFCAFMPLLESAFSQFFNTSLLKGLLEVTIGCSSLSDFSAITGITLAAVFTSFGGICVHLQIAAMLKTKSKEEIGMKYFYLFRPVYVIISVIATRLFLLISPVSTAGVSIHTDISGQIGKAFPFPAIFLLFLALMLLFFSRKSDNI